MHHYSILKLLKKYNQACWFWSFWIWAWIVEAWAFNVAIWLSILLIWSSLALDIFAVSSTIFAWISASFCVNSVSLSSLLLLLSCCVLFCAFKAWAGAWELFWLEVFDFSLASLLIFTSTAGSCAKVFCSWFLEFWFYSFELTLTYWLKLFKELLICIFSP